MIADFDCLPEEISEEEFYIEEEEVTSFLFLGSTDCLQADILGKELGLTFD